MEKKVIWKKKKKNECEKYYDTLLKNNQAYLNSLQYSYLIFITKWQQQCIPPNIRV